MKTIQQIIEIVKLNATNSAYNSNSSPRSRIETYKARIEKAKEAYSEKVKSEIEKTKELLNSIDFTAFTNDKPYNGETTDKIFLTYSDCYRANSPTWQSVGKLGLPHLYYEDRGYIKGIALSLSNYMKLREALNQIGTPQIWEFFPKFVDNKNGKIYTIECEQALVKVFNEMEAVRAEAINVVDTISKEVLGITARHYLRAL